MKNQAILFSPLLYLAISSFPRDGQYCLRQVNWCHILKGCMPSAALLGYFMGFEGFSLIDSHKWLTIVRRADCLLFGSKFKNECRMFRIQFGGDSKEQALEHCYNCVQKLADYVTVQVTDEQSQELHQGHSQLANSESQVKDSEQNTSMLNGPSQVIDIPPAQSSKSFPEGRKSVTELAQSVLKSSTFELPFAYQHSVWSAEELGPFIRLCLMDQNFPAFVEEVEKELKKLTED